jgi:hypothetical protein
MNVTRILRGQDSTITMSVYSDGDLSDEGDPTLQLLDLDGTVVASPAITDNGDGTYVATVPAQANVALLKKVLTFSASLVFDQGPVEIIGGLLFDEAAARAFAAGRIADTAKYDDDDIAWERARITDWLESRTGLSWVPRYRRAVLKGTGTDRISLRRTIRSYGPSSGEGAVREINELLAVTIDGTAVDVADLELDGAAIWHTTGTWTKPTYGPNVVVDYEYGNSHLRDGVDRIALLELVDRLPTTRVSRAATQTSDEFGTSTWDPQNNGRPSRIPEVNAWCRDRDYRSEVA